MPLGFSERKKSYFISVDYNIDFGNHMCVRATRNNSSTKSLINSAAAVSVFLLLFSSAHFGSPLNAAAST